MAKACALARVLVVDRAPASRKAVAQWLRRAGHDVLEAGSGADCLQIAGRDNPDLIVLAVPLPDVCGTDLCRQLKANLATSHLPIVMVSESFASADPQLDSLETGADACLTGPVESRELLAHVRALLRAAKAEGALRETEHRYGALAEASPEAILVKAGERWVYANPAAARLLGAENPEELIGRRVTIALDPAPRTAEGEQAGRAEKGQPAPPVECVWQKVDGSSIEVEMSVVPIVWQGGPAAQIAARNISERKEAEEALRESRERLRSVLENALDAAYRRDLRTDRYDYLSPVVEQVLGLTPERIRSMALAEFLERVHPDDRASVQLAVEEGFRALKGRVEYRFRADDGRYRWIADHFTVQAGEDGAPLWRVGILRDISNRKEGEQRLRLAKSAGKIGIHDYNVVTGDRHWDERIRELWGVGPEECVTHEAAMAVIHPDDRVRVEEAFQRALDPRGGGEFQMEYRLLRDGRTRWIAGSGQVLFEGGRAVRLIGTVLDITQQKEFQAELERQVRERTAELQLLVRDMEQFSYSMAHDLRAPLRAMGSLSAIVAEEAAGELGEEHADYLRRITSSAKHMDQLIQDVLEFSRVVQSAAPLSTVDLDQLVRGIIDRSPHLHPDQADIEIGGVLLPVLGNEALLTQCVSNLLTNAVKFVELGCKPRVRIWTEQRRERVALFVRDNGIGIPREKLGLIWGLFERVHHRQFPGTGMGLSIVKRAAEKMGGAVGVESEPGKGSTFHLELDRAGIGLPACSVQTSQANLLPNERAGNILRPPEAFGARVGDGSRS